MKTTFPMSRIALGFLLSSFVACTVPPPDELEPAPKVLSFTASQYEVPVGASVKLTWSAENATSVKIDELKLGSVSGVSGNAGEVEVAITGDSLFVFTARNARGVSDTAVVAVRVGAAAGSVLFTGLPNVITAGQPVTLAWSAPGAAAVTLVAAPGGAIDVQGQLASGSVTVNPQVNTTYTLTAGLRTATTAVTVRPTLLSFTASSLTADAGSTVTLSWTTANATRVQLSAPGRGILADKMDPSEVASGSFADTLPTSVDPGALFPYQLTVTGPGETLTDSLVVSIAGQPAVLTFTAPKYVRQSNDAGITLTWTTRAADSVSIAADGVEFYRAPLSALEAGTLQVPSPTTDTTYQLIASNSRGGRATSSALVDVVGLPTVTMTATPASITPGDPVTLGWAGTDVRNVRFVSPFNATLVRVADTTDTGTAPGTFTFATTSVIRLEADNGAGDVATATATVTVTNAFAITQPAGTLRSGESVTLSWTGGQTVTGLPHSDVVVRSPSTGFDDIAATGTPITLSSTDDAVAELNPVGFSAPFFDRVVGERVFVNTNGYLSFGPINPRNYSEVNLPSAKMEPYSIAPNWDDLFSVSMRWQVKPTTGNDQVLIVQWNSGTTKAFQVKLHSTGQLDLEYGTFSSPGKVGINGPTSGSGVVVTAVPAANTGLTFFGPKSSPALVPVFDQLNLVATATLGGQPVTINHDVGPVLRANDLTVGEALVAPASTVGAPGQWFELANTRDEAIDLTGWAFGPTDGGTAAVLSGQVPARGVLVVGASADPALNDDAGVQLVLTGLNTGLVDAGVLALSRNGGNLNTSAWLNPTPGAALVSDFGPYKLSTDTSGTAPHAQTCLATAPFGNQTVPQLGTPGTASSCGFGYAWRRLPGGFFDISTTGTPVTLSSIDEGFGTVPLAAAPFPFFGTAQTAVRVSSNGFLAFDAAGTNSTFTSNSPSTTDANGVAAIFAGNLIGDFTTAAVYSQRVAANVDPAAPAAHWVVQWTHWAHFNNTLNFDDLNFQVKLFDDGTLEYHYGLMLSTSIDQYGSGISSVTWLENPTGTQALVINANSFTPGVQSNSGVRFSPR
ncbi:MAG: hypothetical protein Q8N23_10065 [Archangium sp.]|nr:hypothetical protein [Archangium sp.]MDP3153004.1 hypothetical protein [Archangium sp.]MDP3572608.1 hypothetical protein [Archangium sp.]